MNIPVYRRRFVRVHMFSPANFIRIQFVSHLHYFRIQYAKLKIYVIRETEESYNIVERDFFLFYFCFWQKRKYSLHQHIQFLIVLFSYFYGVVGSSTWCEGSFTF